MKTVFINLTRDCVLEKCIKKLVADNLSLMAENERLQAETINLRKAAECWCDAHGVVTKSFVELQEQLESYAAQLDGANSDLGKMVEENILLKKEVERLESASLRPEGRIYTSLTVSFPIMTPGQYSIDILSDRPCNLESTYPRRS